MIATLRTLAVTGLVAFPGAALAQSQDGAGSATSTDGDPASGLSMGTVDGEPQVGARYEREVHGDWQVRCVKTESGQDPCQLYQLLSDGQGNSVAEFSIFNLPEGQQAVAGATVITPLETLLTAELRIQVDDGQVRRYPYSYCSQVGCFARVGFTAGEVDAFKAGKAGKVVIVPAAAPDQNVALTLSLTGFTAAWNALQAGEPE